MKKERNTRGITLIALVVTIIVLIILAVVSINMVFNDNGLIKQAEKSKEYQANGTASDEEVLEKYAQYINGEAEDSGGGSDSGGEESTPPTTKSDYLVDIVQIGDYVDINVPYTNVGTFYNVYTEAGIELTGWRVLDKEGAGDTGIVKLVSAGIPLEYYKGGTVDKAIQDLENLYIPITIVNSKTTGFTKCGFNRPNLVGVFDKGKYIDTAQKVHALGCGSNKNQGTGFQATEYLDLDEVEKAYNAMTGRSQTMRKFYDEATKNGHAVFKTSEMQNVAGERWENNYNDLLGNGFDYWLGGSSCDTNFIFKLGNDGSLIGSGNRACGVRPVVYLQSGVKIDSSNPGTGADSDNAYQIVI